MSDQKAKELAQAQRVRDYAKTVHGPGDYLIEVETDDQETYFSYVYKDLGSSFGDMLTNSGVCRSEDRAVDELERILAIESKHTLSGVPMTKEELVQCYGWKTGMALHKVDQLRPEYMKTANSAKPAKATEPTNPMIANFLKSCQKEARNPILR